MWLLLERWARMVERASRSERNKIIIKNTYYIYFSSFSSFAYMKGGMEWIWLESNRFWIMCERREMSNIVVVVVVDDSTEEEANSIFK